MLSTPALCALDTSIRIYLRLFFSAGDFLFCKNDPSGYTAALSLLQVAEGGPTPPVAAHSLYWALPSHQGDRTYATSRIACTVKSGRNPSITEPSSHSDPSLPSQSPPITHSSLHIRALHFLLQWHSRSRELGLPSFSECLEQP